MENAPNSNLFITTTYVLLGWLRFVVSYGCDCGCVALPCRGFAFTFTFTFQCRSESPLPVFYRRVSLTTCFALAAYNNIACLVQMYSLCQLHRRIIRFKYVFNGFVIEKCQKKICCVRKIYWSTHETTAKKEAEKEIAVLHMLPGLHNIYASVSARLSAISITTTAQSAVDNTLCCLSPIVY